MENWSIKAVFETVLSHFIRNAKYLVWPDPSRSDGIVWQDLIGHIGYLILRGSVRQLDLLCFLFSFGDELR